MLQIPAYILIRASWLPFILQLVRVLTFKSDLCHSVRFKKSKIITMNSAIWQSLNSLVRLRKEEKGREKIKQNSLSGYRSLVYLKFCIWQRQIYTKSDSFFFLFLTETSRTENVKQRVEKQTKIIRIAFLNLLQNHCNISGKYNWFSSIPSKGEYSHHSAKFAWIVSFYSHSIMMS